MLARSFVDTRSVNSKGHWICISELHRESAGLLDDWHAKITVQRLIQCAAIAVRRSVYERLGGFLPHLRYVPDWEMWQRIASQFPFCFEPSILACYRVHSNSATSRMRLDAADAREVGEVIELTAAYHSPARGRARKKSALVVREGGAFQRPRPASESRLRSCLATDCRSAAPLS